MDKNIIAHLESNREKNDLDFGEYYWRKWTHGVSPKQSNSLHMEWVRS